MTFGITEVERLAKKPHEMSIAAWDFFGHPRPFTTQEIWIDDLPQMRRINIVALPGDCYPDTFRWPVKGRDVVVVSCPTITREDYLRLGKYLIKQGATFVLAPLGLGEYDMEADRGSKN